LSWETIIVQSRGGRADVILNRPERLNAINSRMLDELEECCFRLGRDDTVRVVVISGAGRAFCSGADLVALSQDVDINNLLGVRNYLRKVGRVVSAWVNLEKPVIAAVNGPALGGGCNLALMCDLIIAREDAVLGEVYTQRALVPDMGGTYFLPRLVGMAKAKELVLLGEAISAAEAEAIGLINKCVPPDLYEATVDSWADRLARGATKAIGLAKTGLNVSQVMDLASMLDYEAYSIAMCFSTEDFREALRAFREKRLPDYSGR